MEKDIMQEVAFLFVEQYEKLVEHYKDSEVALIRATAEKGETAISDFRWEHGKSNPDGHAGAKDEEQD